MGKPLETSRHQTAFLREEKQKDCRGNVFFTNRSQVYLILQGSRHPLTWSHDFYDSWLYHRQLHFVTSLSLRSLICELWNMTPASPGPFQVRRDDAGKYVQNLYLFSVPLTEKLGQIMDVMSGIHKQHPWQTWRVDRTRAWQILLTDPRPPEPGCPSSFRRQVPTDHSCTWWHLWTR